jgi:hypothetical protein
MVLKDTVRPDRQEDQSAFDRRQLDDAIEAYERALRVAFGSAKAGEIRRYAADGVVVHEVTFRPGARGSGIARASPRRKNSHPLRARRRCNLTT